MRSRGHHFLVVAALLCLPAAMFAQIVAEPGHALVSRTVNSAPTPSGATPRMPDGHPDLSGVWDGLGDDLTGVPNQMANDGISIDSQNSAHDVFNGAKIATFPRNTNRPLDTEKGERAASLLRRLGANRPIYKPEYWEMVKNLDENANEEDPSNNCLPWGFPAPVIPLSSDKPRPILFLSTPAKAA